MRLRVSCVLALLLLSPGLVLADTIWNDGNGNWSVAGNWTAGVPNSVTNAIITNGSSVTVDIGGQVASLQVGAGNSLSIGNGNSLAVYGSSRKRGQHFGEFNR